MFKSTRFKLTFWYVLIALFISLLFSVLIYFSAVRTLELAFHRAAIWSRAQELGLKIPTRLSVQLEEMYPELKGYQPQFSLIQQFEAAKKELKMRLIVSNIFIVVGSSIAGYFLSGRTLQPLAKMIEEQKRFISDASHELKTPIAALKAGVEVDLRSMKKNDPMKQVLDDYLKDINSLEKITLKLLRLSRLNQQTPITLKQVNVSELVNGVIRKMKPIAIKRKIKLSGNKIDLKMNIFADKACMEEMLIILIDNAIKFNQKDGEVKVNVVQSKKSITFKILDTGSGISKSNLKNVFSRFYQCDQSRECQSSNSFGLGLSIAKRIVELHQGTIVVNSKIGDGSTFIIQFPTT